MLRTQDDCLKHSPIGIQDKRWEETQFLATVDMIGLTNVPHFSIGRPLFEHYSQFLKSLASRLNIIHRNCYVSKPFSGVTVSRGVTYVEKDQPVYTSSVIVKNL
jgi:hypothetical protein